MANNIIYQNEINDFTPKEFFMGLLNNWLVIFLSITLTLLFTLLFYMSNVPSFTSSARMLIEDRKSALTNFASVNSSSNRNTKIDATRNLTNQVQYLKSLDLAKKVDEVIKFSSLAEFNGGGSVGKADIFQHFASNLKIGLFPDSNVIEVSYTAETPELAARMVNVITEVYKQQKANEDILVNDSASNWLGGKVRELQDSQRKMDAKIVQYRIDNGIFVGQNNQKLLSEQLTALTSNITIASVAQAEIVARADLIASLIGRNGNLDSARDVLNSALIQQYRQQVLSLQRRIAELSETLLPSHPKLLSLNAELSNVNQQIVSEARNLMLALRNEVEISAQREASLKDQLEQLKTKEAGSLLQEVELHSLVREAEANRSLLESYLAKFKESDVRSNTSLDSSLIHIISQAVVPLRESGVSRNMIFAIMAVVGFILGIVIATFRTLRQSNKEQRKTVKAEYKVGNKNSYRNSGQFRLHNKETRPTSTKGGVGFDDLSFMAAIPQSGTNNREKNILKNDILSHLDSDYAHSFVDLIDNLMVQSDSEFQKHFMISGLDDDSESYEAILNLGRILDMKGAKALVMDLDVESQLFSKSMVEKTNFGFSDILANRCYFEDCIIEDTKSGLNILLAGTETDKLSEIIVSDEMAEFLDDLDQMYDVILIHSNDVLQKHVTDFIDSQVDLTLLVADWEDRANEQLQTALSALKDFQGSDFGLLLMGADMKEFDRVAS